jgi:stress response protein SCP2
VDLIIFLVGIHSGGTLADVVSGFVTLFDKFGPLVRLPLEQSHGSVGCMAVMKKSEDAWDFHKVDGVAERGRTFMDILEPTLGDLIRKNIPCAPRTVTVDFGVHLTKGHTVDVPSVRLSWPEREMSVGVGWDFMLAAQHGRGVNLDVSAVFFDNNGHARGAVSCSKREGFGAVHSGDNRDGKGTCDDERITVNLSSVPDEVSQIFFVVNVRTPGLDLSMVHGAFCRTMNNAGKEVTREAFADQQGKCGKLFARLLRTSATSWCQETLAEGCRGRTWMSAMGRMQDLFRTLPPELRNRKPSISATRAKQMDASDRKPRTARLRAAMIKRSLRRVSQCGHRVPPAQATDHNNASRARFVMSL